MEAGADACSRGVRLFVLGRVNKAGKTHKKRVLLLSCWWQGGRQQAAGPVCGGGGRNGSGMEPGAAGWGWAERGVNPSEVVTFALHTVLLLHTDFISCMLWLMHSN